MAVYLLHFETPYRHAQHYVGFTEDLEARLERHRAGNGARLLEVVTQAGIAWELVRAWPRGSRELERAIKRAGHSPRLCPVCNPEGCWRMRRGEDGRSRGAAGAGGCGAGDRG